MRRGILLLLSTGLLTVAVPAVASADTWCVNDGVTAFACTPTNASMTGTSVTDALAGAFNEPGDDVILIGPGTFSETGLSYNGVLGNAVFIVGAGKTQTTLTAPADNANPQTILDLQASAQVTNLAIQIQDGADANTDTGLKLLTKSTAAGNVAITGANSEGDAGAVLGSGSSMFTTDISMDPAHSDNYGVRASGTNILVSGSKISGAAPVRSGTTASTAPTP